MDVTYKTRIVNCLARGPMTYGDISRTVVLVNTTASHADFRTDFGDLLSAGRIRRVGTTPDGTAYLFDRD